jgi:hypothetical protein
METRRAIDLILDHLRRHGRSLWGHVVRLSKAAGGGTRVVDRTNNLMEGTFKVTKHGERRRSGRKVLTHDLESMPPAALLVHNIERQDYLTIVCNVIRGTRVSLHHSGRACRRGFH